MRKVKGAPTTPEGKRRVQQKLAEQCGLCALCSLPAEVSTANLDHIKPKSLGGGDEWSNLQATHVVCNVKKGNGEWKVKHKVKTAKIPKDRRFSTSAINRAVREKIA